MSEPKAGETWVFKRGDKTSTWLMEGPDYGVCQGGNYDNAVVGEKDDLLSTLTSPGCWSRLSTGEAEKPAEPDRLGTNGVCSSCGSADPKNHWSDCVTRQRSGAACRAFAGNSIHCASCNRHRLLHPLDKARDLLVQLTGSPEHDREIAKKQQAHNDAFHEKQKAAILANYEAQRREPAYQPSWQRTGVQTYSRRVPK